MQEDPLEQEAQAKPYHKELDRIDELTDGQLQEHILLRHLPCLSSTIAQAAMVDDPEIERRLTIINHQRSKDTPVVPAQKGPFETSSPETKPHKDSYKNKEKSVDARVNAAGCDGGSAIQTAD